MFLSCYLRSFRMLKTVTCWLIIVLWTRGEVSGVALICFLMSLFKRCWLLKAICSTSFSFVALGFCCSFESVELVNVWISSVGVCSIVFEFFFCSCRLILISVVLLCFEFIRARSEFVFFELVSGSRVLSWLESWDVLMMVFEGILLCAKAGAVFCSFSWFEFCNMRLENGAPYLILGDILWLTLFLLGL